jgi:Rieske 2Fe-2S family protein
MQDLVRARQPGWSLEQAFYTDADIFDIDMARIFRTGWLFAGHACQIPRLGATFWLGMRGAEFRIP